MNMASPHDASDPEVTPEEEEEVIEAGFDPLLFWDQHRVSILAAAAVIVVGLVGYGYYSYAHGQMIAAAGAALTEATTADDYRAMIAKYPGTVAAGDASLMLGAKLKEARKYDEAIEALQDFVDKHPTHPMAGGADLSIAEALEEEGKKDEAVAKYAEVAAKYPEGWVAPMAVLDQANLLAAMGKTADARRLYENFVSQFPDSTLSQEAMVEMRLLKNGMPGEASQPSAGAAQESVGVLRSTPAPPPVQMPGH